MLRVEVSDLCEWTSEHLHAHILKSLTMSRVYGVVISSALNPIVILQKPVMGTHDTPLRDFLFVVGSLLHLHRSLSGPIPIMRTGLSM